MKAFQSFSATDLLQRHQLAAGRPQRSEQQLQTVAVRRQQGRRRLLVLLQQEVQQLALGPQQGRGVGARLLQEPLQQGQQRGEDGLEEEHRVS